MTKFGAVEDAGLELDRIDHWVTFGAFCLDKDIVRRDKAVLGFINMCVVLRTLHHAMDKGYRDVPIWIAELEDSKAFNSIIDWDGEPFDRLRQLVGSVHRESLLPRPVSGFSVVGSPSVAGPGSALSSESDILNQYFVPDEEAVSVASDARFSTTSVADDARIAAKMVADDDRDETQRQAQVAADQQLAARLGSTGPMFPTATAVAPTPVVSSAMMPMRHFLKLPIIPAKLEPGLLELQLGQIRDARDEYKTMSNLNEAMKHYVDFQRIWLHIIAKFCDPTTHRVHMTPAQEVDAINECVDNILADLRRPTKQLIKDMNTTALEYVQKENQETGEYIKKKKELIDQTVLFGREGNLFDTV